MQPMLDFSFGFAAYIFFAPFTLQPAQIHVDDLLPPYCLLSGTNSFLCGEYLMSLVLTQTPAWLSAVYSMMACGSELSINNLQHHLRQLCQRFSSNAAAILLRQF